MTYREDLIARVCAAAALGALLGACSGWEPIDFHETSNIPEGPGLISGDKGGFTIFRIEEKKEAGTERTADADDRIAGDTKVE